jgi:AcrR family transcriptional regulator
VSAAERLFATHGFSTGSMPMIAEASGITAGAIYKHFDSKADLFFEVVRRAVRATSVAAAVESPSNSTDLAGLVANHTSRRLRLLRKLAVEVHYASARHPDVRRLLRKSLDLQIRQIGEYLATGQHSGKFDPAADPELLACTVLVFIMGLMHMETLLPQLVDDPKWRNFVQDRVAALVGMPLDSGLRQYR